MEIISRKEAMDRGLKRYFTGNPCKYGHIVERSTANCKCVICGNEASKKYQKQKRIYSKNAPLRAAARQKAIENKQTKYFHGIPCSKGHIAERETANGRCCECSKIYRKSRYKKLENKEKAKQYRIKNKHKYSALSVKRLCKKLKATPNWLSKNHLHEIEKIYYERDRKSNIDGEQFQVDHIIPLQGKNVCGLHVPWNLQIITAEENSSKRNKLPPQEQLRFRGVIQC